MAPGTQFVITKDGKDWKSTVIEAVDTKSSDGKLKHNMLSIANVIAVLKMRC